MSETIDEIHRPVSYTVRLEDDRIVHRHVDHLQSQSTQDEWPQPDAAWEEYVPTTTSLDESDSSSEATGSHSDASFQTNHNYLYVD